MKAINFYIENKLPADLRDFERSYDAKGINSLMGEVARRYPDRYAEISDMIQKVGLSAAWRQGATIGLEDLRPLIDTGKIFAEMDSEVEALRKETSDDEEFNRKRGVIWSKYNDRIQEEIMAKAKAKNNPIAQSVLSGARGKAPQLKAMLATPGLYSDFRGELIPNFTRRSFAEGVRPIDYLAGTFGARSSVISTKAATARGGDFAKQLNQVMAREVITAEDCGTTNGIDLDADDPSVYGRVLVRGRDDVDPGTPIDRLVFNRLSKKGGKAIVRSPLTCEAPEGLCSKCAGMRGGGKFPSIGDHVGASAGTALGEPITQGSLNCLLDTTSVRMADGGVKQIRDILPEDMVLGADVTGKTFPVRVTHIWDQGMRQVRTWEFRNLASGRFISLTATDNHKVLSQEDPSTPLRVRRLQEDGELRYLIAADKADSRGWVRYGSLEISDYESRPCWDITVDHPDHLFVLANGAIVSNSKHTAGMASTKRDYSGFSFLNQFAQSPEQFPDRAAVAEEDGKVESIREAPQGGYYVKLGTHTHYVLPNRELLVSEGDIVEAGDVLSEGLADPKDIVRLKGLGEGRRYYTERLHKMLEDSGFGNERRNVEILARAALNHVRIDDSEDSAYLPDDVVFYNSLQSNHEPAKDARTFRGAEIDQARGLLLERPVLHYTIGTRLTPKVLQRIKDSGMEAVVASDKKPSFEPFMIPLRRSSHAGDDWMAKQHTSYLTKNLQDSALRGEDTDTENNIHFAPRLARGVGFGTQSTTTGKF